MNILLYTYVLRVHPVPGKLNWREIESGASLVVGLFAPKLRPHWLCLGFLAHIGK